MSANFRVVACWFMLFMVYSFGGWIMEMLNAIIRERKFYNRGFLLGPICPIYGFGAVMISLMLGHTDNIFIIFGVSVLAAGALEYFTSLVMEKIFHVRWWDYADRTLNLRGRICLENLLAFGFVGILAIRVINPAIFAMLSSWDSSALFIVSIICASLTLADLVFSLWLIIHVRTTAGIISRDATEEITKNVKKAFAQRSRVSRRLVKAFPGMEVHPHSPRKSPKKQKQAHKTTPKLPNNTKNR